MEFVPYLSAIVMTAFLTAVVIFLYLRAERSLQLQSEQTSKLIEQTVTLTVQTVREQAASAEDSANKTVELAKHMLEETVTQLEAMRASQNETLKMAQQSMDSTMMRSSAGLNQMAEQISKTLSSTVALLGTSDTVAYQQVMGSVVPLEHSNKPYPEFDEAEYERLEQERVAKAAEVSEAMSLLEQLGVPRPTSE